MRLRNAVRLIVCCLFLSSALFAAKITGKVTNGTTNKPSAGDEVVLLSLAGGMEETARTKTDGKGEFSFDPPDQGVQHLIQVTRQGVKYFRPVMPGRTTVEVTVYDAAKKLDNLMAEGRVIRAQAAGGELQVIETYFLRNESKPPRTWNSERTLEVAIPQGAKVEDGRAAGPGGMPIASTPVPTGKNGHYAFDYPIRPGRSQLQVTYKMPYGGAQDFNIQPDMPLAELGVMLPKSMHFSSSGESFLQAPDEQGVTTYVAKSLSPGQKVTFSISGEGSFPPEPQGEAGGAQAAAPDTRPGGGLGVPTGAPDPLSGSRWYILGGIFAVMAGFGIWMMMRKPSPQAATGPAGGPGLAGPSGPGRGAPASDPRQRSAPQSSLLDALKDELFQLETDRLQGKISPQDYDKAKAGLDMLFRRHMKKAGEHT